VRPTPIFNYAEECRSLAAMMKDPTHKKQFKEMAEAWTVVASEHAMKTARTVQAFRISAAS
jgi:hypothetical protein